VTILTKNQKRELTREFYENGQKYIYDAVIRFDDECNNGHNSFSITGTLWRGRRTPRTESTFECGGCTHDIFAKVFPEYAHLLKWHLHSTDGPMRTVSNALYHASEKDCWGRLKGEPYAYKKTLRFVGFPFTFKLNQKILEWIEALTPEQLKTLEVYEVVKTKDPETYSPNYHIKAEGVGQAPKEFENPCPWYGCSFNNKQDAVEMVEALKTLPFEIVETPTRWGKGKNRDYNAFRNHLNWPDATNEMIELPPDELKPLIEAHIEKTGNVMRKEIEAFGFTW